MPSSCASFLFVSAICWLEFSYFKKYVRIFDNILCTRHFTADCFSNHMKPKKKKKERRERGYVSLVLTHPFFNIHCFMYSLLFPFHSKMHQNRGSCIMVKCHFVYAIWHFHFINGKKVGTSPYQKKKSLTMKIFLSSNLDGVNNGLCLQGAHLLSTVNLIYTRFLIFHSLCGPLSQFSFQGLADNETWICFCIDDH